MVRRDQNGDYSSGLEPGRCDWAMRKMSNARKHCGAGPNLDGHFANPYLLADSNSLRIDMFPKCLGQTDLTVEMLLHTDKAEAVDR